MADKSSHPNLVAYLTSFNILSPEEIESFAAFGKVRRLAKDDYFIQEGRVCRDMAFVQSGMLRSFYHASSEEEVTYCFTFPQTLLAAYSSFITQEPTVENIQAMMEVELICFPREEVIRLEQSSVNWLRLTKIIAEQEYLSMERRILLLQREKAEQRYQNLLSHHPEYLQQIPLNYLASYLGITQRHLSRIRKALSN